MHFLKTSLSDYQTERLSRDSTISSYSKLKQDIPQITKGHLSAIEAVKAFDEPIDYYRGKINSLKDNFATATSNKSKEVLDTLLGAYSDNTYSVSKNIVLDGSPFGSRDIARLNNKPVRKEIDNSIFGLFGKHEYQEDRGLEINMNGERVGKQDREVGQPDKGRGYKLLDRMPTAFKRRMSPSSADIVASMGDYYRGDQLTVYGPNELGKEFIGYIESQPDNSLQGMFYEWKNTGKYSGMKDLEPKFSEIVVPEKYLGKTKPTERIKPIFTGLPKEYQGRQDAFTHIHPKVMWNDEEVFLSTGNVATLFSHAKGDKGWNWFDNLTGRNKGVAQQNLGIKIQDPAAVKQLNRYKEILQGKRKTSDGKGYEGITKSELDYIYEGVDKNKRLILGGAGTNSLRQITEHLTSTKNRFESKGKQGTIYVTGPYISDMGDNEFVNEVVSLRRAGHKVVYLSQPANTKMGQGEAGQGATNTIAKLQQAGVTVLESPNLSSSFLGHFKGFYSLEGSVITSHNIGNSSDKNVAEAGFAIYDAKANAQFVQHIEQVIADHGLVSSTERRFSVAQFTLGRLEFAQSEWNRGSNEASNIVEGIYKPIVYATKGFISNRQNIEAAKETTLVAQNTANPMLRAAYLSGTGITLPSKMNPSYHYAKAIYNKRMHDTRHGEFSLDRYTRGPAASLFINSYAAKNGRLPDGVPISIRRYDEQLQSGGLGAAINIWGIENGYGRIIREELGMIGSVTALFGRLLDQSISFYTTEISDPYAFLNEVDMSDHGFKRDPGEGLLEGAFGHAGKMLQGALFSAMAYVTIGEPINLLVSHLFKTNVENDLKKALHNDAGLKLQALAHNSSTDKTVKFFGLDNPFSNFNLTLNHVFLRKRGSNMIRELVVPFMNRVVNPYTNYNDKQSYLNMIFKIADEIEVAPDLVITNMDKFENFNAFKQALVQQYADNNEQLPTRFNNTNSYQELYEQYQTLGKAEKGLFNKRMSKLGEIQFDIENLGISRQMTIARSLQDILDETPINPLQWGGFRRFLGQPTYNRPADGGYNKNFMSVGNILSFEDITRNIEIMLSGRGGFTSLIRKYDYVENVEALTNAINKLDNLDLEASTSSQNGFMNKINGKMKQISYLFTGIALETIEGGSNALRIRNLMSRTNRIVNRAEIDLVHKLNMVTGYTYLTDRLEVTANKLTAYISNANTPYNLKRALFNELANINLGSRKILNYNDSAYEIIGASQVQVTAFLDLAKQLSKEEQALSITDRRKIVQERLTKSVREIYDVISQTDAKLTSQNYGLSIRGMQRQARREQFINGSTYKEFRARSYNTIAGIIGAAIVAKQLWSLNEGISSGTSLISTIQASLTFAEVGDHSTEFNVRRLGILESLGNLIQRGFDKGYREGDPPMHLFGFTLGDAAIGAGFVGQVFGAFQLARMTEGIENRAYSFNISNQHNYFKANDLYEEAKLNEDAKLKAKVDTWKEIRKQLGYADPRTKFIEGSLIDEIFKENITILDNSTLRPEDREAYRAFLEVERSKTGVKSTPRRSIKKLKEIKRLQNNSKQAYNSLKAQLKAAGITDIPFGEDTRGIRAAANGNAQLLNAIDEFDKSVNIFRRALIEYEGVIALDVKKARSIHDSASFVFTRKGLDTFNVSIATAKGGIGPRTAIALGGIMLGSSLLVRGVATLAAVSRELTESLDPFVAGAVGLGIGSVAGYASAKVYVTGRFPTALMVGRGSTYGLLAGIALGTISALGNEGGVFKLNKANKVSNAEMVGLVSNLENFSNLILQRYAQGDKAIGRNELMAAVYARFVSSSINLESSNNKGGTVASKALQSPFHFVQFFVAQRTESVYFKGHNVRKRTFTAGMQGAPISGLSFSFSLPVLKYEYELRSDEQRDSLGVYGTGYVLNPDNHILDLYAATIDIGGGILTFAAAAKVSEEAFKRIGWSNTNNISDLSFKVGKFTVDAGENIAKGTLNIAAFLFGANYRYMEDVRRSMANNLDTNFASYMNSTKASTFMASHKKIGVGLAVFGGVMGFLIGIANENLITGRDSVNLNNFEELTTAGVIGLGGAFAGATIQGGSYMAKVAILDKWHNTYMDNKAPTGKTKFMGSSLDNFVSLSRKLQNINGKYGTAISFVGTALMTLGGFHAIVGKDFGMYEDFTDRPLEREATAFTLAAITLATGALVSPGFYSNPLDKALKQTYHLDLASTTEGIKKVYHSIQAFRYKNAGNDLFNIFAKNRNLLLKDEQRLASQIKDLKKVLEASRAQGMSTQVSAIEDRIQALEDQQFSNKVIQGLDDTIRFQDPFNGHTLNSNKAIPATVSYVVELNQDQVDELNKIVADKSNKLSKGTGNYIVIDEIGEATSNNIRSVKLSLNSKSLLDGSLNNLLRPQEGLYVDLKVQRVAKAIRSLGNTSLTSKVTGSTIKLAGFFLITQAVAKFAVSQETVDSALMGLELYSGDSFIAELASNVITAITTKDRRLHNAGNFKYWVENNELMLETMNYHSLSPAMAKKGVKPVHQATLGMLQDSLVLDDTNVFFSIGMFGVTGSNKEQGDVFRAYVQLQGAGADVSATAYAFSASFMFRSILSNEQTLGFVAQGLTKDMSANMDTKAIKKLAFQFLAVAGKLPPLTKHRQFSTALDNQLATTSSGKLVSMAIEDRLRETRRLNKLQSQAVFASMFRMAAYQQKGDNIDALFLLMLAGDQDKELSKNLWELLTLLPGARPVSTSIFRIPMSEGGNPWFMNREKQTQDELEAFYTGEYSLALQYKTQREKSNWLSTTFRFLSQAFGTIGGVGMFGGALAAGAFVTVGVWNTFQSFGNKVISDDTNVGLTTTHKYYMESWFLNKSKGQVTSKWSITANKIERGTQSFSISKGKDVFTLELPEVATAPHAEITEVLNDMSAELDRNIMGSVTDRTGIYGVYTRIKGVYEKAGIETATEGKKTLTSVIDDWVKENKDIKSAEARKGFKGDLSTKIKNYLINEAGIKQVIHNYVDTIFNTKITVRINGAEVKVSMGLAHPDNMARVNEVLTQHNTNLEKLNKELEDLVDKSKELSNTRSPADPAKHTQELTSLRDEIKKKQAAIKETNNQLQAKVDSLETVNGTSLRDSMKQNLERQAGENIDDILKEGLDDNLLAKTKAGDITIKLQRAATSAIQETSQVLGLKIMQGLMQGEGAIFSTLRHGFGYLFGAETTDSKGFLAQLNKHTFGRLRGEATEDILEAVPDDIDSALRKVNKQITENVNRHLMEGAGTAEKFGKGSLKTLAVAGDVTDVFETMGFYGNLHRLSEAAKHDRISDAELRLYSYDAGYATVSFISSMAAALVFTKALTVLGATALTAFIIAIVAGMAIGIGQKLLPEKAKQGFANWWDNLPGGIGRRISETYKGVGNIFGAGYQKLYDSLGAMDNELGDFLIDLTTIGIAVAGTFGMIKASDNQLLSGTASSIAKKIGLAKLLGLGLAGTVGLAAKQYIDPDTGFLPGILYRTSETVLKGLKDIPVLGYSNVEGFALNLQDRADYGPLHRRTIAEDMQLLSDEQADLLDDVDGSNTLAYLMGDRFGRETNVLNLSSAYSRGMISSPRAKVTPQIYRELQLRAKLYAQSTYGEIVWRQMVEDSKNGASILQQEAKLAEFRTTQNIKDYVENVDKASQGKNVVSRVVNPKTVRSGKIFSNSTNDNLADAVIALITDQTKKVEEAANKAVKITGADGVIQDRVVLVGTGAVDTRASYIKVEEGSFRLEQDSHELVTMLGAIS